MCLLIFTNILNNALLTEASQSFNTVQTSSGNPKVHPGIPIHKCLCASTRLQLLYLFIYCQWATELLTCLVLVLDFFYQTMPLFHIFQFYFVLTEASTFQIISWIELKISLTCNFLIFWPKQWALNTWRHGQERDGDQRIKANAV